MAFSNDPDDEMLTEINMTPLIDVMLVLLIVFMVTLPVVHHAVSIQLPRETNERLDPQPDPIAVDIGPDGSILWNKSVVDEAVFEQKLAETAARTDKPALQLFADKSARYESVAVVLSAARRAGLGKINFVTEAKLENGSAQ
ncbi:ExbD/TolR family protein [Phyllobacterium endophyticum]|uniref:Biopolymer transporter ExbD n=1 Tax=Phyllobacterium endophyticum TaxID=1149773 RepID=A0A2P7B203_9HYPH|nr:biopolymer transporter ExbD [Phyllobacterium endophyticum]MBB3238058.1 biopolymer transport protein ExbD [Phyllobacterium endophyticum]PSH60470.1 biopolymer transporter ExbD [Phyllobacterium endophyticum]TYR42648.1 biopolymer transporter ExbD [Phyllobacterium endophyticum]